MRPCLLGHDEVRYDWCPYCPSFFTHALENLRRWFARPTPVPAQCKHERTYYDAKGERCRLCGAYVSPKPKPLK